MWQGDVTLSDAFVISLTGMLVVMLELIVIAVFILILSRLIRFFGKDKPKAVAPSAEKPFPKPVKMLDLSQKNTKSDGELKLEGVNEEETAIIMSAVSAQSGKELDKINFKSIRKI
ncbi:MAG: OadG family protein [Clostridiales bacterium]|nr:OadG family protein [Clostridia bacterium]MCR4563517.1 OadG family protein [Clostridiales bacterium]